MEMDGKGVAIGFRGFTLIEVAIALVVFSIGVIAIIGMLMIGEKGISSGDKSLVALQAARGQMELLRNSTPLDGSTGICTAVIPPSIHCWWSIKKGVPEEGMSTLEVFATWPEGGDEGRIVLTMTRFDAED